MWGTITNLLKPDISYAPLPAYKPLMLSKKFDWADKLLWLAVYQVSVRPAKICLGSLSHQSYESWWGTEKQMVCLLWGIIYNDFFYDKSMLNVYHFRSFHICIPSPGETHGCEVLIIFSDELWRGWSYTRLQKISCDTFLQGGKFWEKTQITT